MKLPLFLILSLSSLFSHAFTALSNPNPFSDGATPSPIFDVDGRSLQAGVNYIVLPVTRGSGGGLLPANVNQKASCPSDIIQEGNVIQTGLPVVFSPVETKTGSVPLSTDVNVKFFTPTVCSNETVWRVGEYDELLKQYFIVTGGVEGNPGPETIANWFKIEKYGSDYKFMFCPSVCGTCQVVCKDVGIYVGAGGTRFLALSDTPLAVMFKSAVPWGSPVPFPPVPIPPAPVFPAPLPPAPDHPAPLPPAPYHPAPFPPAPGFPAPVPPAPDASSAFDNSKPVFYGLVMLTFGGLLCFF